MFACSLLPVAFFLQTRSDYNDYHSTRKRAAVALSKLYENDVLGLMIHLTSSVHCIFSRGHAKLKLLVSHTFSLPSLVRTTFLDQLYSINTEHIRRSLISPPTNAKRVAKTHDCACPLESQTRTSKGIAAETKNGLKHKERLKPKEIWLKSHRCVNHVVMMR